MPRRQLALFGSTALALLGFGLPLPACGGGSTSSQPASSAPAAPQPLRVMVTNDDGVSAPGIGAAVQALRALRNTQVTVVAPAQNESGSGNKTTGGALTVTNARTASGYPAKAVAGYPADTVIWAVDDRGLPQRPSVVVSGVNDGENLGPVTTVSGTVGAAKAAAARRIPALAASQGVDDNLPPDFRAGAAQVVAWVTQHRAALVAGRASSPVLLDNLNVPTCPGGVTRGPVQAPLATDIGGRNLDQVDCSSKATNPPDDVAAYTDGFTVISPMSPTS